MNSLVDSCIQRKLSGRSDYFDVAVEDYCTRLLCFYVTGKPQTHFKLKPNNDFILISILEFHFNFQFSIFNFMFVSFLFSISIFDLNYTLSTFGLILKIRIVVGL